MRDAFATYSSTFSTFQHRVMRLDNRSQFSKRKFTMAAPPRAFAKAASDLPVPDRRPTRTAQRRGRAGFTRRTAIRAEAQASQAASSHE